ncbi:EVE domain-containing protein [Nonomuraea turcica]|uniref:EVE domain-containing protein n=1 Tax=Nonomuraea sp. G32 TaxID=3067274 RepID=UPI00273C1D7F|nr:EVE domain-containing protein [Nonomuraea sp. G32]MDP4510661.1 EVE domain-containing protein [Nonomuraea sp. G32]
MRPRKVDLAFDWMRSQPRRAFHYRDEVWAALAEVHSDEFAVSDDRKTPWFSLHRDMTQDARFLRGDKGMFELVEGAIAEVTSAEVAAVPDVKEPRVWIFQANPKFYRILEALQHLDRMQFLTNRYKDRIHVGDVVLLWMSGNHAGIYAQARVVEGVADRKSDGDDAAFWADPSSGATTKPRVVLAIEKRFLGNPLLKTTIAATEGLANLMILRQPNGTNFPVDADAWELLRPLLPTEETREPAREVLTWAMKRARAGKIYDESCNELLERFVAETFADGEEHSRDEITSWFAANYPLFKPITVQCHIEKYTTNFRSRVHYNATPEHDLLFRVDDDWARLRLYRPGDDPAPIHDKPDAPKRSKAKTPTKAKQVSPLDRNRRLLAHLATLGELTPGDLEDLRLDEAHLSDWLDSLLARRPEAHVVTPLFFHLIDGDAGPSAFTTRLAARFMGEHLRRHAPEPIPELEEHVWARFGRWHLTQAHGGDQKTHAYLSVPIREPRDVAASERLDLFAQLPPKVIGDLIREPEFLSEQQSWSADAASKSSEGPLSTQLRRSWKRPLLLSTVELLVADDGQVLIGEMERTDVMARSYVVAGLPLCRRGEWEPAATLGREAAAERLFQHPVAAALLQFEVHRLFAGLAGDVAAPIHIGGGVAHLELDGAGRGPLWRHVRSMLKQVGYWPVGASTQDSLWASAVHVMLKNLELLDVFERDGDVLRLTDDYQSKIKAHPGHLQNRGEKPYRVRLSQFLAALHGGQA